jgi:imidazolonepropionase-like amidohydrolase
MVGWDCSQAPELWQLRAAIRKLPGSCFRVFVFSRYVLPVILRLPLALVLVYLTAVCPLAAQQASVVRAARMLDVARGEIVAPAVVVIAYGRTKSVGAVGGPENARVIDLGDLTLLPGLIDAHTHLSYDISGDWVTRSVRELPADAALRGARNARKTLLAGFTTVRDVGAGGFADISLMKAIDDGMVEGPRMIPSAHAIGITGGHCDDTGWAPGVHELSWRNGVADGVGRRTGAAAGALGDEGRDGSQAP